MDRQAACILFIIQHKLYLTPSKNLNLMINDVGISMQIETACSQKFVSELMDFFAQKKTLS